MLYEVITLEDEAEGLAPHASQEALRETRDLAPGDRHPPLGRAAHASEEAEKGRRNNFV